MSERQVEFFTDSEGRKTVRYLSSDRRRFLPLLDGKTGNPVDLRPEARRMTMSQQNELVNSITRVCSTD